MATKVKRICPVCGRVMKVQGVLLSEGEFGVFCKCKPTLLFETEQAANDFINMSDDEIRRWREQAKETKNLREQAKEIK
jgi:hypothetical protein